MDKELQEIADEWGDPQEYLPEELRLNDDHPSADDYSIDKREIEMKIMAFGRAMKPQKRELARLLRTDMKVAQIAKKLGRSTGYVYKHAKNPEVIRLTVLMDHLQQLIDGASADHRKAVLWRIMRDNESKRPNISVQCIQEMNKMSGTYADPGNQGNGNVYNIQINGETMPRGPLDVMPDTFETRQAIEGKVVE